MQANPHSTPAAGVHLLSPDTPLRLPPPLFLGVGLPSGLMRDGRVVVGVFGSGEALPNPRCGGGVSVSRGRSIRREGDSNFVGLRIPGCALPPRSTCNLCTTHPASASSLSSEISNIKDDNSCSDSSESATRCRAAATFPASAEDTGWSTINSCEFFGGNASSMVIFLHTCPAESSWCASNIGPTTEWAVPYTLLAARGCEACALSANPAKHVDRVLHATTVTSTSLLRDPTPPILLGK